MPDRGSVPEEERRWVIYRRTGEWDDAINGPDVDEIVVAPLAELQRYKEEREQYRKLAEIWEGRYRRQHDAIHDAIHELSRYKEEAERLAKTLERTLAAFWGWEGCALAAETDPEEQDDAADLWRALLKELRTARSALAKLREAEE